MIAQAFNNPNPAMVSKHEELIAEVMLKTAPPKPAPPPRSSTVVEDVVVFFRENPESTATKLADHYTLSDRTARSRIGKAVAARAIRNIAKRASAALRAAMW